MGQYFTPVIGNRDLSGQFIPRKWFHCHDYDSGLKFMEFSYKLNQIVVEIMDLLMIPQDVSLKDHIASRVIWAGDYEVVSEGQRTLYDIVRSDYKSRKSVPGKYKPNQHLKYIINLEKNEWVNQSKAKPFYNDTPSLVISPLAVLTATEMPRGGGDYQYNDSQYIGRWKGDLICTTTLKSKIPKDCVEITPEFVEEV